MTGTAAPKARYTEDDDPKRLVGGRCQHLRRAVELYERNQPASRHRALRQVIAERPDMEIAYGQLAMLQWEMGQPADAIATLARVDQRRLRQRGRSARGSAPTSRRAAT